MNKPTAITMPSGAIAYTCETADQVAGLPFYYLCQLSDQTHFTYPHKAVARWMSGPFTVLGFHKKR